MIVLRLRRFGERRMLPVSDLRLEYGRLVASFTRRQIEDSPDLSGRHPDEDPWRSKSYWFWEEPAVAGHSRPLVACWGRWPSSSGSSGTAKPCRTTPSPTTSGS